RSLASLPEGVCPNESTPIAALTEFCSRGGPMQNSKNHFDRGQLRLVLAAFAATLCWLPQASAQSSPADPVEELRQVLKTNTRDPNTRQRRSKVMIEALHSLGDLRRALVLREWRDEDLETRVAAVDLSNRAVVARRFEQGARDILRHGDTTSRLVVLNML